MVTRMAEEYFDIYFGTLCMRRRIRAESTLPDFPHLQSYGRDGFGCAELIELVDILRSVRDS